MTMLAFHDDPAIKAKYLARVRAHRRADDIIHGVYWTEGKGCAVGCTIHGDDHVRYETELGIPRIVAQLEDRFFEGMSNGAAQKWPERFLNAIPVGADLSNVWCEWALWMLLDDEWGVVKYAQTERTRDAIWHVGMLYAAECEGVDVPVEEWQEARAGAYADAVYASYAVDASGASYAVDAYVASDTASGAREAFYRAASLKLLDILRSSPVPAKQEAA